MPGYDLLGVFPAVQLSVWPRIKAAVLSTHTYLRQQSSPIALFTLDHNCLPWNNEPFFGAVYPTAERSYLQSTTLGSTLTAHPAIMC